MDSFSSFKFDPCPFPNLGEFLPTEYRTAVLPYPTVYIFFNITFVQNFYY